MSTLTLLRGGSSSWSITSPSIPSSCQLVSIEGITIGSTFDCNLQSATVTVTLLDPEKAINYTDLHSTELVSIGGGVADKGSILIYLDNTLLWIGHCSSFMRSNDQVELSLTGDINNLDTEHTWYTALGLTPRHAACEWMYGALGYSAAYSDIESMSTYDDDFYRSSARVAADASTLGTWPDPYSYGDPHLYGFKAEKQSDNTYQKSSAIDYGTYDDGPWVTINNFNACPDAEVNSETGCLTNPLLWHQDSTSFYLNCSLGHTNEPVWGTYTAPDTCNWLGGVDEWIYISAVKATSSSPLVMAYDAEAESTSEMSTTVRVAPMNKVIGTSMLIGLTGGALGAAGVASSFKTVKIGTYDKSRITNTSACWLHWFAGSPPTWTTSKKIMDAINFKDVKLGRAQGSIVADWGATCGFTYNHPDTSSWTVPTSTDPNYGMQYCVEYSFQQTWTPVTITQSDWTQEKALQAAWLDGTFFVETPFKSSGTLPAWVPTKAKNLYPEKGNVFEIPLCSATASNLQYQQDNPLPKKIVCNYTDFIGRTCKVTTTNFGDGEESEKSLNILQGSFLETDTYSTYNSGTSNVYYSYDIDPTDWNKNPGCLADRYSGVTYDNDTDTISFDALPATNYDQYGFSYLDKDGNFVQGKSRITGYTTRLTSYSVRDQNGSVKHLFAQPIITAKGPNLALDSSPLTMMKKASERVYSNPYRPTYTVTASMVFATVDPGTVLVLEMPSWDSGNRWLCLLLSKSLTSTSEGITLTIAPMHVIGESDYTNYDNLATVLNHYTFGSLPSPVILGSDRGVGVVSDTQLYGCSTLDTNNATILADYTFATDGPALDLTKGMAISYGGKTYTCMLPMKGSAADYLTAANGYANSTASTETTEYDYNYSFSDGSVLLQIQASNPKAWRLCIPDSLATGTHLSYTTMTAYRGCYELYSGSSAVSILASSLDTTKSIVVKIGSKWYSTNQYVSGSPSTILTADNGFPNSTYTTTTTRALNATAGGVWLVQTSSSRCYVFIPDELVDSFSGIWINQAGITLKYNVVI